MGGRRFLIVALTSRPDPVTVRESPTVSFNFHTGQLRVTSSACPEVIEDEGVRGGMLCDEPGLGVSSLCLVTNTLTHFANK